MQKELGDIRTSFHAVLGKTQTLDAVEELRISYLGRKGALAAIFDSLKNLPAEERKKIGEEANRLRREIEERLAEKKAQLEATDRESILKKEWIDVTRPGIRSLRGHLHPITTLTREITAIFSSMGFAVVEGPEVESEYYNFDALNIPAEHPARDMWDTFWLKPESRTDTDTYKRGQTQKKSSARVRDEMGPRASAMLLRTHTSPVQIRYMETHQPPIRIIVPGRVYRYEATDASHDVQFSQLEGLVVDKEISVAHFKAVIAEFFSRLFKQSVAIRLRPSYFPFTEPSFEVDISCTYCDQKGCPVCKRTGWLELAGAGMVHPAVFRAAGYNPKDVTGFAFGMGIDRLAMMKYKIPDIRLFRGGDLRFLKQF